MSQYDPAALRITPARPADIDQLRAIDEDAAALFAEHGIQLELSPVHPFSRAEVARWSRAAELGRAFVAVSSGEPLGFAVLDVLDGEPYLDQLAVRIAAMRRGIGGRLLDRAVEWARANGGSTLWLTTYAHLPFNRPYYERHGFVVMPRSSCSASILRHLDEQRRHLPAPELRVAMRRLV